MSKRKKIQKSFPATLKLMGRHGLGDDANLEDVIEALASEIDLVGRLVVKHLGAGVDSGPARPKIEIVPAGGGGLRQ